VFVFSFHFESESESESYIILKINAVLAGLPSVTLQLRVLASLGPRDPTNGVQGELLWLLIELSHKRLVTGTSHLGLDHWEACQLFGTMRRTIHV